MPWAYLGTAGPGHFEVMGCDSWVHTVKQGKD